MDEPRAAELVPDTPKHDHEESASQSLLYAYAKQPSASFGGPSLDHASTQFASQVPATHPKQQRRSPSPRPRRSSAGDESRMEVDGAGEVTTVCDSQMPPRRTPSPPPVDRVAAACARRASGETTFSHSQPSEVPSGEGNLGETQAESLAMGSGMSERQRDMLNIRHPPARDASGDFDDFSRGDEEVSMDLTRADGRVLEQGAEGLKRTHEDDEDEPRQPTPSAEPQPSESQKENPPSSRPASNPSSTGLPAPLRPSQAHLDAPSATVSSSPAVADQLLHPSSPKKPNSTPLQEPVSSADPDIPPSQLIGRRSKGVGDAGEMVNQSTSGPETSTPAYANPDPPRPLTVQRTNPHITYQSQTSSVSASPQVPVARSAPALGLRPSVSRPVDFFPTSDVMKAPPPRKRQKKDPFDSLSSQSDHSLQPTQTQEGTLEQTVVHFDPEEPAEEQRSQATPKPTAERTADMDIDQSDPLDQPFAGVHRGELFYDESLGNSSDATSVARPPAARTAVEEELRNGAIQPATSPSSERSLSRQSSQVSARGGGRGKRLSDIPTSSQNPELPPTQFEVAATQTDYDLFSHSNSHASAPPLNTQDISFNNGEPWHGSYAVNTETSFNHSRDTTSTSLVSNGRALKRNPPAPTPVRDGVAAAKPRSSPTRTQQHESSLPLDPTQLESSEQAEMSESTRLPEPPPHFFSAAPGPTQSVPESSPEVPLARKRPRERSSRSPSQQPVAVGSSSGEQQQHAISSNGLVPDSEGPTQAASSDEPSLPPVASTSKARPPAVRERDEQVAPQQFYQDDFGGGFDDGVHQEMRDAQAEEDEEDQLDDDEPDLSPPPRVAVKGAKDTSRTKKPAAAAPKPKKVAPTVKKATVASSAKAKGRALQAEDTPDALDFLSTASSSRRRPVAADGADPTAEETNYSELPSAKNAKKRSPKKAAAPVAKGKGRRKASIAPSEDEDEDEDEGSGTEKEEEAPARKRRRSSAVVEEEDDEDDDDDKAPPKKGRRASDGKATAAKGKKVVKAEPAKEKKAGRGRHSKTVSVGSAASASRSPEPEQPVAGPSRLRFQSVDDEIPAGAVSPATTEGRSNSFGSVKGKSRLSDSAPFNRIFGKWRDDGHFYPGTIVTVSGGRFHIVFDDDSKGKLLPDEIRRCELQQGDLVRYVGAEEGETETQVETLKEDVRVVRVERNTTGEDVDGELQADDIVVAASTTHAEGRITRLQINAVSIHSNHAKQFDDRKLTPDELAAFDPRQRQKPAPEPLTLAKPPKSVHVKPFVSNKHTTGLFSRTAFLITYGSGATYDKQAFVDLLQTHGATILEWEHLFEVNTVADSTSPPELFWPKVDFKAIDQIFLLADRPCTTVKYLIALALGIPCVSKEMAVDSIAQNESVDWRHYVLTAGYIQHLNTQALGGQLASLLKASFDLNSLKTAHDAGGVFKERTFLVVSGGGAASSGGGEATGKKKKQTKDEKDSLQRHLYTFLSLLSSAGASLVHFVSSPADASAGQGYDHVFLIDDGDAAMRVPKPLSGHKGLVNITWVKQCLMAGRLLPSARMKEVEEGK
ncbi:hypothetical protein JCM6882_006374 [Rhodosporidiobolus microsporus]